MLMKNAAAADNNNNYDGNDNANDQMSSKSKNK